MPIKQAITDQRVPVKIWTDDVDERSKAQLANIAGLPFVHHHVAAMPDVHLGIGATIGSVIPTVKAIAVPLALRGQRPAAISVIYVGENADSEAVGARLTSSAAAIRAEMGQ